MQVIFDTLYSRGSVVDVNEGEKTAANCMRERRALCGICSAGCGVIVTYDDEGRIARVRADEDADLGIVCNLGEHAAEIVYSEDRVLYPLKRNGPKGTHAFERISWDEAYDSIVARLKDIKEQYGPEAVAIYTGSGSFELSFCDIFQPKDVAVSSASSVLFPFGSPNTMGVGALCYVSFAMIAPHVTMGRMHINTYSDYEHANLIVVWGTNPATDFPPITLRRILAARARGAEVVVIDPPEDEDGGTLRCGLDPHTPGNGRGAGAGALQRPHRRRTLRRGICQGLVIWVRRVFQLCTALPSRNRGIYHRRPRSSRCIARAAHRCCGWRNDGDVQRS